MDWSILFSPHISQQVMYGVTRSYSTNQPRNYGEYLGEKAGLQLNLRPELPYIEINRAQEGAF